MGKTCMNAELWRGRSPKDTIVTATSRVQIARDVMESLGLGGEMLLISIGASGLGDCKSIVSSLSLSSAPTAVYPADFRLNARLSPRLMAAPAMIP